MKEQIEFSDWEKLDLVVGKIESVEDITGADKLYKLSVNLGSETRTVCAGIKQYYKKEELKGKNCVVLANLRPRNLKGIESKGMILASSDENHEKVVIISPESAMKPGSKIS
ncbi:MAG: methionine--tRNA ligase subunit beta [Nanoarchaeota archaeon]